MIGAAMARKYVSLPMSVFKEDEDNSKGRYFVIYQAREDEDDIDYARLDLPEKEVRDAFITKTSLQAEHRGLVIDLNEREIILYSPDEPNPKNVPTRRGQNVHWRLIGYWIQSKGEFKTEILDEKEAGDEDMIESTTTTTTVVEKQETKKERMARYRNFYKTLGERFNGTSNWFYKRERFMGIYFKEADGVMGAKWFYAYSLRDAYIQFSDYVEKMVNAYAKRG
jgi:hypothetical protein